MLQTMAALIRGRTMVISGKKKAQTQQVIRIEDMNIDYEINDIVQGQ